MKMFMFGFVALLATGSAFAAAPSQTTVIHDKPGAFLHLDIDTVLSSTDLSNQCGVIPAKLDYLNHMGQEHVLDYQVEGTGCSNQN